MDIRKTDLSDKIKTVFCLRSGFTKRAPAVRVTRLTIFDNKCEFEFIGTLENG